MGAVGLGELDVLDERDFFQNVLGLVPLVQAPVDDREGEGLPVHKKNQSGHREKPVEGPGYGCKLRTAIAGLFEPEREKKIGLDKLVVDSLITLKEGSKIDVT